MSFDPSSRYQDRIESSASIYNNPYRCDPAPARAYESLQRKKPKREDSSETEQQRLERQLMSEFQRNNFRLPLGRFVVIAEAGKFLVLAILLPPYIFFYGMPKWMLEQVAPPIQQTIKAIEAGIEKIGLRISAWKGDVFAFVSERLRLRKKKGERKKRAVREGDNLFKLFYKDMRPYMQAFREQMHALYAQVSHRGKSFLKVLKEESYNLFQQSLKNFSSLTTPFVKFGSYLQNGMTHYFELVNFYLKKSFKEALKLSRSTFDKGKEIAKKMYEPFQWIQRSTTAVLMPLILLFPPFAAFVEKKVQGALTRSFELSAKPLSVLRSITVQSGQILREKLAQGIRSVWKLFTPVKRNFQRTLKIAMDAFVKRQKEFIENLQKVAHQIKRIVPPLKGIILKIGSNVLKRGNDFLKKSKEQAKRGCALFKKGAKWAMAEFQTLPKRIVSVLKRFLLWLYRMLKKMTWGIRIALTWAKILTIHAIKNLTITKT